MKPSQICRHFRTKKMFIPELADEVFARENGAFTDSSHCWCLRTLTETGPDDQQVGIQICNPSRRCFEE